MKVLIVGGGGQVARAVASSVTADHRVVVKRRAELDITDAQAVAEVFESIRPDWVINAAAYTAVDLAEDHREEAFKVNDVAVGILERAAARAGSRFLHLSTDFVFDGRSNVAYLPGDKPNPLSVYGSSKLAGESKVLGGEGEGIVLRTAWVYSPFGRNFMLTMLRLMAERDQVRVVCDQIGAPTSADSLASAIWALIDADASSGICHWTDLGVASWYDFAVAIQDEALTRGLLKRAAQIVPISTAEYPTAAQRPAFSVLNTESTRAAVKVSAEHWRQGLRKVLDVLQAQ